MTRKLRKAEFAFVRNRHFMLVASLFIYISIGGFLNVAIAGGSENYRDARANSVQSSCPHSEQAEIYIKKGIESAKNQDYVQAIQAYTEAIKLCDKNAFIYYNRANSYTNIHDYNDAINDYK